MAMTDFVIAPLVYETVVSLEKPGFKDVNHFFNLKKSDYKLWKELLAEHGPPPGCGTTSDWLKTNGYLKKGMGAITPQSFMPCPYGGGAMCAKHGGDGANNHKMGYTHQFAHVSEHGGRPDAQAKGPYKSKKAAKLDGAPISSKKLSHSPSASPEDPPDVPDVPKTSFDIDETPLGTTYLQTQDMEIHTKSGMAQIGHEVSVTASTSGATIKGQYAGSSLTGTSVVKLPDGSYLSTNHVKDIPDPSKDLAPWAGLHAKAIMKAPEEMQKSVDALLTQAGPVHNKTYKDYFDKFAASGYHAFMVGGTVRDMVSGQESHDVDIVTDAPFTTVQQVGNTFGGVANNYPTGALLQVGSDKDTMLDITCLRSFDVWPNKKKKAPHIKGQKVSGTIRTDVASRDFACNALFYDHHNSAVIDPTGRGVDDAKNKILSPSCMEGDEKKWLENDRLGLRMMKMVLRGYKPSDELKKHLTPAAFTTQIKNYMKTKNTTSIGNWVMRQVASNVTGGSFHYNDLTPGNRAIVRKKFKEFKDAMYEHGYGSVYDSHISGIFEDTTGQII